MPSRTDATIPEPARGVKGSGPDKPLGAVGLRIRDLRRSRRLTLEALSQASGLSKSFLSDIERGRCDVTLTSLQRIAQALGVQLADFFPVEEPDGTAPKIVRAQQRREFRIAETERTVYASLTGMLPDKQLEALHVTLLPDGRQRATPYSHAGEEFGFILEGVLTLIYGDQEFELGPGDSIHFRSTVPHAWENRTKRPVRAIWVVTPPIFGSGLAAGGKEAGR